MDVDDAYRSDVMMHKDSKMNNIFEYQKVSGWLNHNQITYLIMRLIGIALIGFAVWNHFLNSSAKLEVKIISNTSSILTGIYFLFPKRTGFFKQREFISIEKNTLTWNLDDIEKIKQLKLDNITKAQHRTGSIQLISKSGENYIIPVHRILNQTKLDEFVQYIDNRFS